MFIWTPNLVLRNLCIYPLSHGPLIVFYDVRNGDKVSLLTYKSKIAKDAWIFFIFMRACGWGETYFITPLNPIVLIGLYPSDVKYMNALLSAFPSLLFHSSPISLLLFPSDFPSAIWLSDSPLPWNAAQEANLHLVPLPWKDRPVTLTDPIPLLLLNCAQLRSVLLVGKHKILWHHFPPRHSYPIILEAQLLPYYFQLLLRVQCAMPALHRQWTKLFWTKPFMY